MKEEPYRRRCPRAGEASMRAKYLEAAGFWAGIKTPRALAWTDPERACSLCALLSAQLAQLVEQRTENPRVPGSIPGLGTKGIWRSGGGSCAQVNRAGPPSGTSAFDNFAAYAAACKRGEVAIGRMFVWSNAHGERPACIANVPTKRHWRQPSRLEDVEAGLDGSRCSTSSAL